MRLAQMRAIAAPLASELPPLAGAGGSWLLHIPNELITTPTAATGETIVFRFPRLVGIANEPQLMERWSFVNVRLPIVLSLSKQKAASTNTFTAELVIKRNSDVVFAQVQEAKGFLIGEAGWANVLFAADLTNPFTLDRGQQLQIEVRASASAENTGNLAVSLAAETLKEGTPIATDATLAYNSHTLTGHRVLS